MSKLVQTSALRCLRKVLFSLHPEAGLGHELNFYSVKDKVTEDLLSSRLHQLSCDQLELLLGDLCCIFHERTVSALVLVERLPSLLPSLASAVSKLRPYSAQLHS